MINEVLQAVGDVLPERLFWLLPGKENPELTIYTRDAAACVRVDENLPVFVVTSRHTGTLMTWGEGDDVMDALSLALQALLDSEAGAASETEFREAA